MYPITTCFDATLAAMLGVATRPATGIDHCTTKLAIHLGQHVAQVEENALQVHADHGIKRQLVAIRGRRNLTFGTRLVEEAIDLAVFFNSRLT